MRFKTLLLSLFTIVFTLLTIETASAFTYAAGTKTARMTAVRDQIDLGAGAGKLEIGPAGLATVCVTVTLNDPSGAIAGNVLTLAGFPKTVAASGTCTAAEARIRDSNNTDVITGLTVGISGSNINLDNTSINSGQSVTINAVPAINHAP